MTSIEVKNVIISLDTFHFVFFSETEIVIHFPTYCFTITTDPQSQRGKCHPFEFPYDVHVTKEEFLEAKDLIEAFTYKEK